MAMLKWISGIVGDSNEKQIKKLEPVVATINELEPEFVRLSDEQLREKTVEFQQRHLDGESLDDILPEAFAAVRVAAQRTLGQRHFDVQLMGGMVLHQGKIAEMRTGEGKTLVATLPVYLNALSGKGVHIVTVNDYLARRDTQWMGPIYHLLGLTVGCIQHEEAFVHDPLYEAPEERLRALRPVSRPEAYRVDITYGTNNEFGFDYLRDNMVIDLRQCAQRELHYAIVDEVDNILIDEARTPLIISGQAEESTDKYYLFARLVPRLRKVTDYEVDEKRRVVTLTEEGIAKMERWLDLDNLYDPRHYHLTAYLEQALKAEILFKLDRDYVVKDGEVIIVDEFTGRLMHGRRYSEGLHQAIEAKEGVRVQRETKTLATITFQNYFRMYDKLAGMTGTASTESEEFHKIYGLEVITVPTNKPMIREDRQDLVYRTEEAKFRAVVSEIDSLFKQKRPVLVGTVSIEKSELLSQLLERRGVPHRVLNAKQHEKEAGVITLAGQPGAVTIATNMAGRGVDITLGEGVRDMGGLHIVGTERHEARRIDNQLRGRAGRQGDPGSSQFYLSLEDDLMRRFGGGGLAGLMDRIGLEEDQPIQHSLINKAIENAQTKVEGYNFDIRKHVVEYDDVMNKQREVIYADRRKILTGESFKERVLEMVHREVDEVADTCMQGNDSETWDTDALHQNLSAIMPLPKEVTQEYLGSLSRDEVRDVAHTLIDEGYTAKEAALGEEMMRQLERMVMLRIIDELWVDYLTAMEEMREGIGLRAYGQRDPLIEYKAEGFRMFQNLLDTIQREIAHMIFFVTLAQQPATPPPPRQVQTNRSESSGPAAPKRAVSKKVGRNDPCPCGSGKKYKKCCGA